MCDQDLDSHQHGTVNIDFAFATLISPPSPHADLKIENHTPDPIIPSKLHKTHTSSMTSSMTMPNGSCCVVKRIDACKNQKCRLNCSFFYLENTSQKIALRVPQNRLRFINIIVEGYYINTTTWTKFVALLRVKICSVSEIIYIFQITT